MPSKSITLTATFLVVAISTPALAEDSPPIDFDDVEWQSATPEDIHIFDPYIGIFRSETYTADGSGKQFYFTIQYDWYDAGQTIVKFTILTHIPEDGIERLNGEGFYGYDPFNKRIYANGFFPRGISGWGWMTDFDTDTYERVTRVHSQSTDGVTTEVRDTFWVIDDNSWGNATFISVGGGDWQQVNSGTYTRMES